MRGPWKGLVVAALLIVSAPVSASDAAVEQALRSALLGRPDDVRAQARVAALQPRSQDQTTTEPVSLAGIERLAGATMRPLPSRREALSQLSDHRTDFYTKPWRLLLRRAQPTERYLDAAADRRYESRRRTVNAVIAPVAGLAQGEFSSLIAVPFDLAELIFVGRPYANAEDRRELRLASTVVAKNGAEVLDGVPAKRVEKTTPRRRRTAELQAATNGRRAAAEGRTVAAAFWFARQLALANKSEPIDGRHKRLQEQAARTATSVRESLAIGTSGEPLTSTAEVSVYTSILRSSLLADPGATAAARLQLAVDHPGSEAAGSAAIAEAAANLAANDPGVARLQLATIVSESTDAESRRRAADALGRLWLAPEPALTAAQSRLSQRRRDFLLFGEDPALERRGLTGEEARLLRGSWINRSRGLFVADVIGRLIFWPLMDPMPRPELLDATAAAGEQWLLSPDGATWLSRRIKALGQARRHEEAARLATAAGRDSTATRQRNRAARRLERSVTRDSDPRLRAGVLTRLLNAYPNYKHAARVATDLALASHFAEADLVLTIDEIEAWPDLLSAAYLQLDPRLYDGGKGNGEIDRHGLALLPDGLVGYQDAATKTFLTLPVDPERSERAIRMARLRRNYAVARTEALNPMPRRRIPLALEAGLYPGVDILPGLVPLDPNQRERRLYE